MTSQPRPFTSGEPRCATCHRASHRPGTYQGHWFTYAARPQPSRESVARTIAAFFAGGKGKR